jgi:hypothetical protein
MKKNNQFRFRALIYKTGINFAVDVPASITSRLTAVKGYIRVKGTVNKFPFTKSLVPVKNGPYRLFVNMITLKGAQTKVGATATFIIEQDAPASEHEYPVPPALAKLLRQKKLLATFNSLTPYRKKEILRYLAQIKTDETMQRNVLKLVQRLEKKSTDVRIP